MHSITCMKLKHENGSLGAQKLLAFCITVTKRTGKSNYEKGKNPNFINYLACYMVQGIG